MANEGRPFKVLIQFPELAPGMRNHAHRVLATTMKTAMNHALKIIFAKSDSHVRQRVNRMVITVERIRSTE